MTQPTDPTGLRFDRGDLDQTTARTASPTAWPPTAAPILVADPLCGHLPGEPHDGSCDYWRGVLTGEYPPPDAYMVTGEVLGLPTHLVGLAPLTDRALRGDAA